MFVRKKRNRSGTTSVSVVFKNSGSFKEVHHIGSSADPDEIRRMYNEGREWIAKYGGQQQIDFDEEWRKERADAEANALAIAGFRSVLSHVERTTLDAPQAILDGVIGNNFVEAYAFMKEEGKKLGLNVIKEISEPIVVANNGPVPQKLEP